MTEQPPPHRARRRRAARRDQGPPDERPHVADGAPGESGPTTVPERGPADAGIADAAPERLRQRPRRRAAETDIDTPGAVPSTPTTPAPSPPSQPSPAQRENRAAPSPTRRATDSAPRSPRDRRQDQNERAMRGLVTTRGTQISWSASIRARDDAMPDAADLAAAEAELVIVRRNYTPPEPLKAGRGDLPSPPVTERPRRTGRRRTDPV